MTTRLSPTKLKVPTGVLQPSAIAFSSSAAGNRVNNLVERIECATWLLWSAS
ncbi:MAG TPA: hypothetical protein V6D07_08330 [Trichocoleus sp.]